MRRHLSWLVLVLGPLLVSIAIFTACASNRPPDDSLPAAEDTTTTVSVDNRGFPDMTIYVLDGARRVRLGMANGNTVTELPIPPDLVRGGSPLRFLCDPIGGSREPVSDEIMVHPGDQIMLVIPAS